MLILKILHEILFEQDQVRVSSTGGLRQCNIVLIQNDKNCHTVQDIN